MNAETTILEEEIRGAWYANKAYLLSAGACFTRGYQLGHSARAAKHAEEVALLTGRIESKDSTIDVLVIERDEAEKSLRWNENRVKNLEAELTVKNAEIERLKTEGETASQNAIHYSNLSLELEKKLTAAREREEKAVELVEAGDALMLESIRQASKMVWDTTKRKPLEAHLNRARAAYESSRAADGKEGA